MRALTLSICVVGLLDVGCDKSAEQGSKTSAGARAEGATSFDEAAALAMLQGRWTVSDKGKEAFSFEFHGRRATVTDRRFKHPKTHSGALEFLSDTELGVVDQAGTRYRYRFLQIGDRLHMGFGTVLDVPDIDAFSVTLEMFDTLERDARGCRLKRRLGSETRTREIACRVSDEDGRRRFHYQDVDPFDTSRLRDRELIIVGRKLVDKNLLSSVAIRL